MDQQPWDPSVKALTAIPSVLGNMDKNLSWTSSLGDAYYNQQQDVMDAIQVMRQRAQGAGELKTTPQQTVTTQDSTISVQPANPEVVYVPAYNPWMVYGDPIMAWRGGYPYPGIWYGGPYLSFGMGFGMGYYGGFGWGWNHWGFNWGGHYATYGGGRYYSRSITFYNRNTFYRGGGGGAYNRGRGAGGGVSNRNSINRGGGAAGGVNNPGGSARGGAFNRPGSTASPFNGNRQAARGYTAPRGQSGAGHFVKMVHNGIEYGIMAAYAKGLNILRHANAEKQHTVDTETTPLRHPENYPYELNLAAIAEVWRRGSVIASWLLDLAAMALLDSPDLVKFAGRVLDSGEGRWTIAAALDEAVPAPVLSAALYARFSSRDQDDFADKMLSALRHQFGGHEEKATAK